jgi:hypothetical protein
MPDLNHNPLPPRKHLDLLLHLCMLSARDRSWFIIGAQYITVEEMK